MPSGALQLTVSELFVSVQGEGPSIGKPAAFVRLGNCNLTCSYCDTPYTWDFERFDATKELSQRRVEDVVRFLLESCPGRVIITGGEPLIQQKLLADLLALVDEAVARQEPRPWAGRLLVEIETNGTIQPTPALARRVDQWNVSPKLEASGEPEARRLRAGALAWFSSQPNAFFKFVVASEADAEEATGLVRRFGLPSERVLLMPEAKNRVELEARELAVSTWAAERRFGTTTRLHLKLWDGARGT